MNTTTKTLFAVTALFSCVIVAQASDHNHDHITHSPVWRDDHSASDSFPVGSCVSRDHDSHTAHAPNEENHLHGPEVEVSVSAQKLIGIKTVRVSERQLDESIDLWGRFDLSPSARTAAVSPVQGTVSLKVRYHQEIRKGDTLFTVSSPELRARLAEIKVLEMRLEGFVKNGAKNASLAAELELRRAERAALVGSALEVDGVIAVNAISDGIVTELAVAEGGTVEKGGTVVGLVNLQDLCFKARVPPSDRLRLSNGLPVDIDGLKGRLELGTVNPSEVRVSFAKSDPRWRVGDLAKATCAVTSGKKPSLVVPSEAVVRVGVTPTVFVKAEDDHFIAFAVEVGRQAGGWMEILNFPDEDEEVVVRGQYELKLALSESLGGGGKKSAHFHADGMVHEGED